MTVLFSHQSASLEQTGNSISFTHSGFGVQNSILLQTSGANWVPTSGYTVFNAIYVDNHQSEAFGIGTAGPLILVVEKANSSSDTILKIHEFTLSFDRASASQSSSTMAVTPLGLSALESYYGADLNSSGIISQFDFIPKVANLIQSDSNFSFDLQSAEDLSSTGLQFSAVPLKTTDHLSWNLPNASSHIIGTILFNETPQSSGQINTFKLNVLSDVSPQGSLNTATGALSDGFAIYDFLLNEIGSQFTLQTTRTAAAKDFAVLEYTTGEDLNLDGVVGYYNALSLAGTTSQSVYSPSMQGNNASANSAFLLGKPFNASRTIFQTSGDLVSSNGNFYTKDFHILGNDNVGIFGYTFLSTDKQKYVSEIKPDVILNGPEGSGYWTPHGYVSPTSTSSSSSQSADGVLAVSAAAGVGGVTFATHFHDDVIVFQAGTLSNTETIVSVFENSYYFNFDPLINSTADLPTAAPIFSLTHDGRFSADIVGVLEKNIGEDINNDQTIGLFSATSILSAQSYVEKFQTSSGEISLSLNSPIILQGQDGFLIWNQSAGYTELENNSINNEFFVLASSDAAHNVRSWSASGSLTLTGAYRDNVGIASESQIITDQLYSLVFDTNTSNSLGSVYSVYSFSLHTALDSILVSETNHKNFALRDLVTLENKLGYDITGDNIVGNSALVVQTVHVNKTTLNSENSALSTNLVELTSGDFAIGQNVPVIGQQTRGELLVDGSLNPWRPTTGSSAVGVYENPTSSVSAVQSFTVVEKSGSNTNSGFGLWTFSSDVSQLSLQTSQSNAVSSTLLETISQEMFLGFDITGDDIVGDPIAQIILNSSTIQKDSNGDGVNDSTKTIPAVIRSDLNFYGVDYNVSSLTVGDSHPFIILLDSTGNPWSPTFNYEISGVFQTDSINNQSSIEIIEKGGNTSNPFFQKWSLSNISGTYTAQANTSSASRLTASELIAQEQLFGVDLDLNGTVGDAVDSYIFRAPNHISLVTTQIGNYAFNFDDVLGVNDIGLPILIANSGGSWKPTRGHNITGLFSERTGSAQSITIVESTGSSFSPQYKKWEFNFEDATYFATASTTLSVTISSAQLAALETRKNLDLLNDGVIGDPIKSIVIRGGQTTLDSDNDGFVDGLVTAPSIIRTKSNAYALDLSGSGSVNDTPTSLFLEASNGTNWVQTTNHVIIGGFVSYGINTSSQQTTSAFVYEQTGTGSASEYKKWHFLQGNASGVATATSGAAQTIPLSEILAKELELGFDLNNDDVIGDRIIQVTHKLPAAQVGAPAVVKLASSTYGIDFEGNASVGQLKPITSLKTSGGQNWIPSTGDEVVGVYYTEEVESTGQIKTYVILYERANSVAQSFNKWIFSKPSSQNDLQATALGATTVSLTDLLSEEEIIGFDLNKDGVVGDTVSELTWQPPTVTSSPVLNAPTLVKLTSDAYGVDFENVALVGSTAPLLILSNISGSNWKPTNGSTVTGVYSSLGGTTTNPINQTIIIERSGTSNFPAFKTWTFNDSSSNKAIATTTNGQSITESALIEKELEVGYDLNGDETVGDGIFSIALLSKDYLGSDQQVLNSPGVVRLSSGEFGLVFGGNDYSTENGRSFLLKEVESNGNAWTPASNPSPNGLDYSISGVELLDNGDLKIYEVQESVEGDPDVKVTTFTLSESSPESYFVKNNQSDSVAISDSEFFNRELEIGYNLDSNQVLGPGAEEIVITPKSFTDKFEINQNSPALVKLADGSVAVDFTGSVQLGETPKLILNQGGKLFRYSSDEQAQGLYTSTETNDTTNQVTFNVNILQQDANTNLDSFFLRTFNVVDDVLANYDSTKSLQPVSLTEVLSKEEMVRYDLNSNGQVGFQNRELLMPAFSTSPGPDDFRLVRTETNAIGLDSAFTITPENDQYFYSLYDSNGSLWDLGNETVTGVFLEDRIENTEGDDTNVQLRTQSNADTILGVATNPAGGSVASSSNLNLWEFVISGDATPNALGLYEFHMISANAAQYSFDELSIVEADKGFDLTGDRQVLGDTSVELFREQMAASDSAREMVSRELTGLPDVPNVAETRSELLMPGVSLQTENISFGNLTSGLKKGTVNSFVSNGNISLNFSNMSTETVSTQPQTNILIDAQVELSYYSLDEPLSEESDLVHFVALGSKERAANSFQAISDFTDVLNTQGSIDESGASVVAPKLKLFDFSGNDPEEVDTDEIILQLTESEGVVLLAPNQISSESTFVNINNEPTASASEILLLGEFTVRGGEGKQTFVGDDSKQDLSLGSGDDIVFAGGGDDILSATDGNNYFDGGAGNDVIAAGSGTDVFAGGAGDDMIDGGDGFDKAKYVGSYYDFTIEKQLDSFSVTDRLSLEGRDTLTNVERLEFADGTLAFDTNGNAGQAYRLYQAAFERTPDPVGVGYHVNDIESNGLILYQIAGNFLASPEFESTYGSNLNDSDFVDALYDNVLGRSPDDFERDYYTDRFSRAENDPLWMDRAASLIGFSESPENMNIVNDDILNGIWMTNDYM